MSVTYLKAFWRHDFSDEAVLWFHELDDQRREMRKVVVFRDGRSERAGWGEETRYAILSPEPLPSIGDINSQAEFAAQHIDAAEFETAWVSALTRRD
jgi:hypothetical protein